MFNLTTRELLFSNSETDQRKIELNFNPNCFVLLSTNSRDYYDNYMGRYTATCAHLLLLISSCSSVLQCTMIIEERKRSLGRFFLIPYRILLVLPPPLNISNSPILIIPHYIIIIRLFNPPDHHECFRSLTWFRSSHSSLIIQALNSRTMSPS